MDSSLKIYQTHFAKKKKLSNIPTLIPCQYLKHTLIKQSAIFGKVQSFYILSNENDILNHIPIFFTRKLEKQFYPDEAFLLVCL